MVIGVSGPVAVLGAPARPQPMIMDAPAAVGGYGSGSWGRLALVMPTGDHLDPAGVCAVA